MNLPFKECPACDHAWPTREVFLVDPGLTLIGYQADFEEIWEGLFLFNHACRGTLAMTAGDFRDLYDGPVFGERVTGSEQCPGLCLNEEELEPCPAHCECAYVREVMQRVRSWPKVPGSDAFVGGLEPCAMRDASNPAGPDERPAAR